MTDNFVERKCGHKIMYPEQRFADQAAAERSNHNVKFEGYHCPLCHGFHIGRRRSRAAGRRRAERQK